MLIPNNYPYDTEDRKGGTNLRRKARGLWLKKKFSSIPERGSNG